MKRIKVITTIALFSIVIIFAVLLNSWIASLLVNSISLAPARPKTLYGEFPFTLTYELDGQIQVIEDVIVCEFDGFVNCGAAGIERKWNTTLKSGKDTLTLLDLSFSNNKNEFNQTVLELYFYYGTGAYYMGDIENIFARNAQSLNKICYKYQTADGRIGGSSYNTKEAFEKYKIRLISWECAPPVENQN